MFVARRHVAAYWHSPGEFADASLRFFTQQEVNQLFTVFTLRRPLDQANDIRDGQRAALAFVVGRLEDFHVRVTFHLREVHLQVAVSDVDFTFINQRG